MAPRRVARNPNDPNPGIEDGAIPPAPQGAEGPQVPPVAPQLNPQVALLAEALQMLINNATAAGAVPAQQPHQPHHAPAPPNEAQFIRDFKRYGPPTFDGSSEKATAAEEWVKELEALFVYLGCNDQFKVRGAVFMLRGEALHWWDSVAAAEDHVNTPITWIRFKDLLYEYYFPATVRREKEAEFLRLTQGTMTVAQYEKKFTELSRFGRELIPTEARKISMFIEGLREDIRGPVDLKEPTTYAAAVRAALVMDRCTKKAQPQQAVASTSGVKRKFSSVPSGQSSRTFQQTQRQGQLPMCPSCKRRHAGFCWSGKKVCFRCGKEGHFARECPMTGSNTQKLGQKTPSATQAPGNTQKARVFALTHEEVEEADTVVTGTIPLSL